MVEANAQQSYSEGNTMIRRIWGRWKVIAQKIGTFQARMLLTGFYVVVMLPFGLGVKFFSDPLRLTLRHGSHWTPKEGCATSWDTPRRQF